MAENLKVDVSQVRSAVHSFFDQINIYSRHLPLDNPRRIYEREKFRDFEKVWNLPFLGRTGPSYSRYLGWRRNESKGLMQDLRVRHTTRVPQSEIETMAEDILSGRTPSPVKKKKVTELYNRVWLVGKEGKKLARQVMPKEKKDVQDKES